MQENNSQNANNILKRLKDALKVRTDIELSELLNIKPNTISTWKKRNSLDYETVISISALYDIDLNYLFQNKKVTAPGSRHTPLISREVQFQFAAGLERKNLLEVVPKYDFPYLTADDTLAYQLVGNNMFPLLVENSIILCEAIDLMSVKDGQILLIGSYTKGMFVNRITRSAEDADLYILSSESDSYSDIVLSADEIKECWIVRGSLTYDINNGGRVQYVYDSLKKINTFFKEKKFTI